MGGLYFFELPYLKPIEARADLPSFPNRAMRLNVSTGLPSGTRLGRRKSVDFLAEANSPPRIFFHAAMIRAAGIRRNCQDTPRS